MDTIAPPSNAVKIKARKAAMLAKRNGDITPPSVCQKCKRKRKLSMHHPDYYKPLEVQWLCKECHDKKLRYPSSPELSTFGEFIKSHRFRRKSLQEIAGISRHTLWTWMCCGLPRSVRAGVFLGVFYKMRLKDVVRNPEILESLPRQEMATLLGLERTTLYKWRQHGFPNSMKKAAAMEDVLGVSLGWLCDFSENREL